MHESVRDTRLKTKYGISEARYNELLAKQNSNCAICGINQSLLPYKLCVDHCHQTGKVRGLLCQECNTALGRFKDDPVVVAEALRYLLPK